MFRRIERVPAYHASEAALPRTAAVGRIVDALTALVTVRPDAAELLSGTNVRAVYSLRIPGYPSLRLFYSIDATTIYLLYIEEFDDLVDDE